MFQLFVRTLFPVWPLLLVLTALDASAWAQSQSMFGSRSLGSRTSTSFGTATSFGAPGSTGGRGGGLLSSRMNASAVNSTISGTGGLSQMGMLSPGGAYQGGLIGVGLTEGFIGGNMAGSPNASTRQRFNTSSNRNNRPRDNRRAANGSNQNGRFNSQAATARRIIRPRLRVAFPYPAPVGAAVSDALQSRFERLADEQPGLGSVRAVLDDAGVVTLRGEVDTQATAQFVEALARLEPGVSTVRNQLTIGPGSGDGQ